MDLVSSRPFCVGSILWQPRPGAFMLTVVCKVTYVLLSGQSRLAHDQDPLNENDDYWNDDERRSLHAASDLVPFKRHADVFLVGHAYAPRRQPVSTLTARLIVRELDKTIEIHADRVWTQHGELRQGSPFVKMPLRYERAGGGPETSNPVGVRADARPDMYGNVTIPNLQPPGFHNSRQGEVIPAIGFGPIAPQWPERATKAFWHAAGWDHRRWNERPLPEKLDAAFFNVAPIDQQVGEIRSDERIVLENLHTAHARLVTSLPGISPRAMVERSGAAAQELRFRCDTLSVDTDRAVCSLVWRGQVMLARPDEAGQVRITTEGGGKNDEVATVVGSALVRAALPFEKGTIAVDDLGTTMPIVMVAAAPALPFRGGSPWASTASSIASTPQPSVDDGTGTIIGAAMLGQALPFAESSERLPQAAPIPPPTPIHTPSFVSSEPAPGHYVEPAITSLITPAPPPMIGPLVGIGGLAVESPPHTPVNDSGAISAPEATVQPSPPGHDAATLADEPPQEEVELSIEQVAAISAEIVEGRATHSEVLRNHDVTHRAWLANERRWMKAIEDEAADGLSSLRSASDRSYVEAVEGFRGPITLAEYAQIVISLERGRANQVLDKLGIQRPALMLILRVWTKKVAGDARLADEARELLASMRGS